MTLTSFLVAFLVALLSAPLFRALALRWGVVDVPCARKLQREPVPLLGGAAVYLGVIAGSFVVPLYARSHQALFLASTLIFVISVMDDKREISARVRLVVQLAAAFLLIANGLRISFLPNVWWGKILEILITLLWILGITNAFNYLDGADGLCAGLAIVAAFFFFIILLTTGQVDLIFLPAAVMGACAGFFPHNFSRGKMFLGDGGSMFLGFTLAGFALTGSWAGENILRVIVPILILGVPIFDMTFTTFMRIKEHKVRTVVQWFEYAGRDHFHHYLMDLGLGPRGAIFFIFAISASMGISALIISDASDWIFGLLMILQSGIMFVLVGLLMVMGRRLHKMEEVHERVGI
ncbi:MAG: MraY family glycosyltransferase [Deltaproteobacteria bacterium]